MTINITPAARIRFNTLLCPIEAVAEHGAITQLMFLDDDAPVNEPGEPTEMSDADRDVLAELTTQLEEYFAGERTAFTVPLAPAGTVFNQSAWAFLNTIPYAQTRTYGQQATALNNPKAYRAVGRANGRNPIAIVVPCHRVIGADKSLTGYAGGIERKQWLLDHERRVVAVQSAGATELFART